MWPDDDFSWLMGGDAPDFSELPFMDSPDFGTPEELLSYYGDPYGDWGGGIGGDGTDGSGDWMKGLGGLLNGAKGLSGLSGLFGKDGLLGAGSGLGSLLPLLGLLGGNLYGNKQTDKASELGQQAAKDANAYAEKLIGGARDDYKPYMAAGTNALGGLEALLGQEGKKFTPLKSRQMAPMRGSMSLADLAKR